MNTITKAYKFRLYPDKKQEKQIRTTFGCCRFVYNRFLIRRREMYEENRATLAYKACAAELTALKDELGWLKDADAMALQSALRNLDSAYQNFFRRAKEGEKPGYPRLKSKKDRRQSYVTRFTAGNIAVYGRRVKLPKLGLVKAAISKELHGRILNATVSQSPSGKYFVSICCEGVPVKKLQTTGTSIGLNDTAIKLNAAAIISTELNGMTTGLDETAIEPVKTQNKLAKAQKALSRKTIGSSNREKARIRLAKLHERIANMRKDSIHKLTTGIVRNYDDIYLNVSDASVTFRNVPFSEAVYAIGSVQSGDTESGKPAYTPGVVLRDSMAESAYGSVHSDKVTRNFACESDVAFCNTPYTESHYEAAWSELVRQLRYKCEWYGKRLHEAGGETYAESRARAPDHPAVCATG